MITFKLGFLLAFSLLPKSSGRGKKKKRGYVKDNKSKKSRNSKQSKKSSNSSNKSSRKNKRPKASIVFPKYVLDVGNPIGYARIEYELLPNRKQRQQIDVICWKGVARVYAGEEILTYRVRILNDKVWVPVYIQNNANQLSVGELQALHKHEINFLVNTSKNKVGVKAKSDKTKLFFMRIEDTSVIDMTVPVFTGNPNSIATSESNSTIAFCHEIINDCINKPGIDNWNEIVVRANTSDKIHTCWMNKIINRISQNKEMSFKDFIPISLPPETSAVNIIQEKKKDKHKKDKQSKDKNKNKKKDKKHTKKKDNTSKSFKKKSKGKAKDLAVVEIKVPGEVFFTDPTLSIYDTKNSNSIIPNAYVLLSVENLMTFNQKKYLNPMIVKIDKIENLDVDLLRSKKFKSIFVRYNVPYVAQATTLQRDIAEKIRYNESHAHFTNTVPEIKLIEFLQSNRFVVEICGVREANAEPEIYPGIFGSEEDDQYFNKLMTTDRYIVNLHDNLEKTYSPMEVLAVATYDLTTLLMPTWKYSSNETCHNPASLHDHKSYHADFENPVRADNVHLKVLFKEKSQSPLTECSLIEKGTCLRVEVSFPVPITCRTNHIQYRQQYYNRILLIIYSSNIAVVFLNEILSRNQVLNPYVVIPNLFADSELLEVGQYLSGFVIDNGNTFAFFLEGANYEVEKVWKKFMRRSPDDMIIYFNSQSIFEERLYGQFLKLRGLCIITLQKPLRDILSQELFYVEGYVPLPCFEAIKKMDLLFRSTSLKDIIQYNLLPTPHELLSVDLEYGTTIRWNGALYKSDNK